MFSQFTGAALGPAPDINQVMAIALAALSLLGLSIFGPAPAGAAMVPTAAVTMLSGGDTLFVRTRAGVVARPVKVGGKDGDRILILSGVKSGEQVVVTGISALKPLAMGE